MLSDLNQRPIACEHKTRDDVHVRFKYAEMNMEWTLRFCQGTKTRDLINTKTFYHRNCYDL